MKNKFLAATILVATASFLLAQEPSAFGAGDLSNPNPYGLTSGEKVILQNKNELKKISVKSNNQAYEVESLRERIDGMQSIVESLSRKSQHNKTAINELIMQREEKQRTSSEYEKRLNEIIQNNSQNIANNIILLEKMKILLEKIDKDYVSKKEFNELVTSVNTFKSLVAKELKSKSSPSSNETEQQGASNYDISQQAQEYYDKKYYTKAIESYEYLIEKNFKPAYAHFMIGQMNFKRKNYADAISYYKKSASLYSKASYMPDLLLNTAISMHRTNDLENAKAFYEAVMAKYPDSSQAITAEASLKTLK